MMVRTALLATPGIGKATADRVLREARIDAARRVGGLTAGASGAPACRRDGSGVRFPVLIRPEIMQAAPFRAAIISTSRYADRAGNHMRSAPFAIDEPPGI